MASNVLHFGATRFRVNGSGNLDLKLLTLDDARTSTLKPLPMSAAPGIEPTRLCNLTTQRARLEGKVDVINEWFKINRIIIYVKETATSLPG